MITNVKPYLITDEKAEGEALIPIHEKDKLFQEKWLQELLYKHPKILPVDLLDEKFSPPISIGREIANIDNLFISPKGHLIIVETKLWRNPEAHRTVVAQILDYASKLATWTYEKLDSAISAFTLKHIGSSMSIYTIVKKSTEFFDYDEIGFQATVQDNLSNGNFALVVVGDRIHPSATQLAGTIQSAPHLQFSLGFVELQCYKLNKDSNWPLIVYPNLILKTKEVTRAVVKVLYEKEKPEVAVFAPTEDKDKEIRQWDRISWYDELDKRRGNIEVKIVKKIEERIKEEDYSFRWSSRRKDSRATFMVFLNVDPPCRIFGFRVDGNIEIRFGDLMKLPPFDNETNRRVLADRLNKIPGVDLQKALTLTGSPSIPIAALKEGEALLSFTEIIEWCNQEIKKAQEL